MNSIDNSAVLSVRGLEKGYGGHRVLRGVDLRVGRGEIHGLLGLNGSGKTTSLECVLGLQGYQKGEVEVLGFAPGNLAAAAGRITAVFDQPGLAGNLTLRQCLQHGKLLCARNLQDERQAELSVETVMALLGLEGFKDFKVKHLSLGNRRRTAIAHALLGGPQLVLMDEPFNGLDPGGVDKVLHLIRRAWQGNKNTDSAGGCSILLSSHQLPYLERVCTHISILHKGRVALNGPVHKLLQQARTQVRLRTSQSKKARQILADCDGVQAMNSEGDEDTIRLELDKQNKQDEHSTTAALNARLVQQGVPVVELRVEHGSLDELFRQITGDEGDVEDEAGGAA